MIEVGSNGRIKREEDKRYRTFEEKKVLLKKVLVQMRNSVKYGTKYGLVMSSGCSVRKYQKVGPDT